MAARGTARGTAKVLGTLRMYIPAGKASPSPPLGPALGQVSVSCYMMLHSAPWWSVVLHMVLHSAPWWSLVLHDVT